MTMDKSTTPELRVHREENFRIPTETERSLALWVDRVGRITDTKRLDRLRILGQYCHIFVLEGEGEYRSTRWGQLPVRAGDCMVQFPDDPCLYHPDSTWTSCWVTWNGPEAAQIHETGYLAQRSPVFRDTGRAVAKAYEQLLPIIQKGDPASALQRKTLLLEMILELFNTQQQLAGSGGDDPPIERALTHIHEHLAADIPVTALAQDVALSPTHFRRRFRAYTGRSPVEYIRDLKMAEAQRLLREGLPIKQIADHLGYQDVFYFMRVFKKTVGLPPGRFARQHG